MPKKGDRIYHKIYGECIVIEYDKIFNKTVFVFITKSSDVKHLPIELFQDNKGLDLKK